MNIVRMFLNWKAIAALGGIGLGVWFVAPSVVLAALPYLLLAACPLAMVVMMWGMRSGMQGSHTGTHPAQLPTATAPALTPQAQLAELKAQQAALSRQMTELEQRSFQATRREETLVASTDEGDVKGRS